MSQRVKFFDTTLRDGEQTPGVNFNTQEKIQIASQLENWGVDCLEAGFPIASKGDFEAVQAIGNSLTSTTVCGLAHCNTKDIDAVQQALEACENKQIHIFIATSPIHRQYKLKKSKQEIIDIVKNHVSYAKKYFDQLQFSAEDATRTEWDFLAEVVEVAIQHGATIINIPDTVGYSNPCEIAKLFQYLQKEVHSFDQAEFAVHCHDDLGLAVANSLAAIENGDSRVEGTVNGIGERAGNTALEEVAVNLHIRQDYYQKDSRIVLEETKKTSDLVSRLSGVAIARNKAIVGANAYAHESGIHQDGVLKNPQTYEIISPQLVGVQQNALPLGKLSGRHAFTVRLKEMGYDLSNEKEIQSAFIAFKDLADKKKTVTENDLHAIMTGQSIESNSRYELLTLSVQYVDSNTQIATVAIKDSQAEDLGLYQESSIGVGSVAAIFDCIEKLLKLEEVELLEYSLDAITEGADAQAEVRVLVQDSTGQIYNGTGIDYDVLVASAKAYLQACEQGSEE